MWHTISAILWKDLKIEWRTREALVASFVFAVTVIVIFHFASDPSPDEARELGAGFLWIAFAFAGVLSLNRSFALEREENAIQGMVASPIDPSAVYVAKFLGNLILMLVTELLVLPVFVIFFNVSFMQHPWLLLLILVLGTIGFTSVGTVFSAIAAYTRARDVLLPILLFAATVPVWMAAVETTAFALGVREEASFWFAVLAVFDVVFLTLGFIVFDFVLRE